MSVLSSKAAPPPAGRRRAPRGGFTLLEVLLALGLSAGVLAIVSATVHLHLKASDAGRADAEEMLLARAVLRRIADDLQNGVTLIEAPPSAVASFPKSKTNRGRRRQSREAEEPSDDEEATSDDGKDGDADGKKPNTEKSTTDDSAASDDSDEDPQSQFSSSDPGIYGELNHLQVDSGRPRRNEPRPLDDTANFSADLPGGVTIVSYFVNDQGLMRHEVNRAVARLNGGVAAGGTSAGKFQLLAPEVSRVEFAYFDGLDFDTEWDSQRIGGLPRSVTITIYIPSRDAKKKSGDASSASSESDAGTEYSLTVAIPRGNEASASGGTGAP